MITLNASGGSVTFTFSGNSTYLNDGTITVPVNSLALIIDESNMATFKKAASNDIFVSANVSEFGMTKAELESWFKTNAVGSTGGGSITVDSALDSGSTNPVQNQALYDELRIVHEPSISKTEIILVEDGNNGYYANNIPSNCHSLEFESTESTQVDITVNEYEKVVFSYTNGVISPIFISQAFNFSIDGNKLYLSLTETITGITSSSEFSNVDAYALAETTVTPLIDKVKENEEALNALNESISGKQDTLIFDDTLKYNKVDDDKLGVYVKIAGGLYGNKKMYGNDTATLDIATIFAPRTANLNFNSSYTGTFDGTNALVVTYYDRNEGEESTSSITWDYSNGNYTTTASTSLVQLTTNPNYLTVFFLNSAYRIVKIEHKGLIASLYNQDEAGYYLNSVEFTVDYDDLNSFAKNVLARLTALENNS